MKTIRRQLTRKLLWSIGLILVVGGVGVHLCARTALVAQLDAALQAKAQAITTLTEQKGQRLEIEFSDEHMRGFEAGGRDFFELWQSGENPVERSRSLGDAHLPLRHGTIVTPLAWNLILPNGQPGRAVGFNFLPQQSDENENNKAASTLAAILVVATTRAELDRTLATLQLVLAGSGLLILTATVLVVPRVLRRELTPLQRLADEAADMDGSSLAARFHTEGLPGECAPITARLNELLARLEEAFERERRFSSDVAHELRTPVAELRSLAELAIKLPDTRAANADHETLAIALHLEAMLKHLLALARGERGELSAQHARVALLPLVQDVCDKFKTKAAARQLILNCSARATGAVFTDAALLRSILTNLLENAVDYAPAGGRVDVEATGAEIGFTLRVVNTVENLTERDLAHLFERFWRKDAARSPDGHTGLGLSIARVFAQAIGCELTATFVGPARLALTLTRIKPKPTNQKTP